MESLKVIIVYIVFISFVAVVVTVKDKKAAIAGKWRVPERTLMIIGLMGGSVAMLITMKIIRHKTKHLLFMLGLPVEIAVDCLALSFIVYDLFFS